MTDLTRGDIEGILGYFKNVILNNAAIANEAVQGASAATLIDEIQSLALEALDRRELLKDWHDARQAIFDVQSESNIDRSPLWTRLGQAEDNLMSNVRAMFANILQKDTDK